MSSSYDPSFPEGPNTSAQSHDPDSPPIRPREPNDHSYTAYQDSFGSYHAPAQVPHHSQSGPPAYHQRPIVSRPLHPIYQGPPPVSSPPKDMTRLMGWARRNVILSGCVGLIVFCLVVGTCTGVAYVFGLTGGIGGLKTSSAAKATPTHSGQAIKTPTSTSHSAIITGATLGGTREGFAAKYGPATDQDLWDVHGLTFGLNMDTGADGQDHVFEMLIYKSDATTWTTAQAKQVCTAFLPPDATYQRQTTDNQGNPEAIYKSARLAVTFAKSADFYDPSGSAFITYVIKNEGVFQCDVDDFG